jgi:hypothetical protein
MCVYQCVCVNVRERLCVCHRADPCIRMGPPLRVCVCVCVHVSRNQSICLSVCFFPPNMSSALSSPAPMKDPTKRGSASQDKQPIPEK